MVASSRVGSRRDQKSCILTDFWTTVADGIGFAPDPGLGEAEEGDTEGAGEAKGTAAAPLLQGEPTHL